MVDFRDLIHDPAHRRKFERLLFLAARRGDADLVAERLGWGVDPNCRSPKSRTPLMANVRSHCPSVATVRVLLKHGADANLIDETGLTALDYARRKMARLQLRPPKPPQKSPSLDENNQLQMSPEEQQEFDALREELGHRGREFLQIYWQEHLRAARRVFNDPQQVAQIVEILEAITDSL
jgi:hypothetical protein